MKDLGKLLHFARPYRKLALFSFVMLLAMVGLDLAIPRLVERVIDEGVKKGDMGVVLGTSALMLCLSITSMVVAVLNSNSSVRVGESVARDLREAIFVKVQNLSWGNLDGYSTGRLMVRLSSDTAALQRLTQVSLRIGTRAPLSMMGAIVLMFVTSPGLAAAMIPILLGAAATIVFFSRKMEPLYRAVQQKLDRLNTVLQENISGARLVKSFVRAGHESERFGEANGDFTEGTVKVMEFMALMSPVLTLFINLGMVLVLWKGGREAMKGDMSLGQIIAFTNYLLATLNPLIMMTQLSNTWANGMASARRVNEILDAEPEVAEAPDAASLPRLARGASVRFEDVAFNYDGSSCLKALEGISFNAEPGETVAILGATGAGKSTLVNLIPRFYDAVGGRVLIDGRDVRSLSEASLLGSIALVPQETILFSGTVRDNIRYGCPGASDEEVEGAARAACAHDFILRLPSGYDSDVEDRGCNLSGGQKQRIAIARAIITRPRILILDDSTSAVDVETETAIQSGLAAFTEGCTCFIVAQRISTVLNADRILVLDGGRLAAQGRHSELLKESSIYREIYDSQLGGGIHGE